MGAARSLDHGCVLASHFAVELDHVAALRDKALAFEDAAAPYR